MDNANLDDAKNLLTAIKDVSNKSFRSVMQRENVVRSCLAVVTGISNPTSATVRLITSPEDGSQDFVVRNRSGSVLIVGDSVWLYYWGDYTNAYIAIRNMGDAGTELTADDVGAVSYIESQDLSDEDKLLAVTNIAAVSSNEQSLTQSQKEQIAKNLAVLPDGSINSNILINGSFDVWQRGVSFSSPFSGAYCADRWRIDYSGTGATRAISRMAFAGGQTDVPGNPSYYLRFAQSVAGSGASYNVLRQFVEDVPKLSGMTVTLSFHAKADSNINISTYGWQNFGSGSSSEIGINGNTLSIGNTWHKYTVVFSIPSIAGKTVGLNSGTAIGFALPINTTFTIDIANVQLNYGPFALPVVPRNYADELRLCQRYYQTISSFWVVTVPSVNEAELNTNFPVTMRTEPIVTLNSQPNFAGVDGNIDRYGVGNVSMSGATINVTQSAITRITKAGSFVTTALYRGSFKLDAEL